jgi:hypothetical protein
MTEQQARLGLVPRGVGSLGVKQNRAAGRVSRAGCEQPAQLGVQFDGAGGAMAGQGQRQDRLGHRHQTEGCPLVASPGQTLVRSIDDLPGPFVPDAQHALFVAALGKLVGQQMALDRRVPGIERQPGVVVSQTIRIDPESSPNLRGGSQEGEERGIANTLLVSFGIGASGAAKGRGAIAMGKIPVTVDVTHATNRILDSWYELFESEFAIEMPTPACAYPGNWDEDVIKMVSEEGRPTWHSLRWNQAQHATDSVWETRQLFVTLEWNLHVTWQGLSYQDGDINYQVIDNAKASVELLKPASLKLTVKAAFGKPNFADHLATLPVWFDVKVNDGNTAIRDQSIGWVLSADGLRERLGRS